MTGDESIEKFADVFSQQLRSGHVPSTDKLEEEFPELTDDLLGLVKTLSILEEAGYQHRTRGAAPTVADVSGQRWTRVGGFRLIREISRGGMGIVYEAEQEALQRRVAIKVLPSSPMLTEKDLVRFRREGTAIARLHHSHIVPVFGTGEQNGIHYCVMQYIEGCSLDRLIRALRKEYIGDADSPLNDEIPSPPEVRSDEAAVFRADDHSSDASGTEYPSVEAMKVLLLWDMSPQEDALLATVAVPDQRPQKLSQLPKNYWKNVARIGADMADALSHAHDQGVLHRDVKPHNLLIDKSGHVWLADFGVAKLMDHDNMTATDSLIGTLRYTPPEQFEGHSDARSDIYSLGLTLYELCALQPAFAGKDRRELMRQVSETTPIQLSRLMSQIPADLENVIHKAMRSNPAERYQSADELTADLRSFIADRPVTARRLTVFARSWRWCRRHRTETALGAIIAVLLISFGLTASVAYVREARLRQESDLTARTALEAVNRVYDSYVPDWTSSSTVAAHGSISVSPATAQTLVGLLQFYDKLADRNGRTSNGGDVVEATAALRRVALIYHRLGMFAESKDVYGRALVRLQSIDQAKLDPRSQLEHARVSNEIGAVYWTDRQIAEAYETHLEALELLEQIDVPERSSLFQDVLFEKARTGYLLGRRARGRLGGVPLRPVITRSQEQFDKQTRSPRIRSDTIGRAVSTLEELVRQSASAPTYRHLLALCLRELTDGQIHESEPPDEAMTRSLELLEQLVAEYPEDAAYRYSLCTTLQWQNFWKNPGDLAVAKAAEQIQRAIQIAAELSQERPDEWIYAAAQVEAYLLMAKVQTYRGMYTDAHESCAQAGIIGQQLAAKYSRCVSFQYWVGVALQRDGENLKYAGQLDEALETLDQAMDRFTEVLQIEPSWDHVVLRDLKLTSTHRAHILSELQRKEEAKAVRAEAAVFTRRLNEALANAESVR